ncbi:uncharacterized protein LOC118495576 [Sander lucioperca]|uniref:uncharacterized protein LOC118495576 n=1 Tax=Sander lucioperca TaxID=283035 RepID=UPI001653EA2B|nr:uncharacterized protein LOC118495576 [Sander lucioperca]
MCMLDVEHQCRMDIRACRTSAHFHCIECNVTIIRKDQFKLHISSHQSPDFAPATTTQCPPSAPATTTQCPPPAPATTTQCPPLAPATTTQCPPSAPATTKQCPASADASVVPPPPPLICKNRESVVCPHCAQILNRRNLRVHLQRRHTPIKPDITAQHHLNCQCIDFDNGVFAAVKSFATPSTPVHVIKSTWGQNQKTQCEMDICKINMDCAERSNLRTFECPHIQSLSYCPPAAQIHSALSEEVLQQMVEEKWFGQDKKDRCLAQQRAAVEAGTPLSCVVSVSGPPSKKYLSVFEPTVAYYSRLGRVMVSFDTNKITWHCPCAKPRQSCIHKYVAKWHLFQTDQGLFRKT